MDPDAKMIQRLLNYEYKRCKGLLAIETKEYGNKGTSGNWTEMEWTGNVLMTSGWDSQLPTFRRFKDA